MNDNCLKGYRCPCCYSEGPFQIETVALVEWSDEGTYFQEEPEFAGGGVWICKSCKYRGTEEDFSIEKSEAEPRFAKAASLAFGREGHLEFDDNPKVSRGEDNGAYVQCWQWMDNPLCCSCLEPIEGKPRFDEKINAYCAPCWAEAFEMGGGGGA